MALPSRSQVWPLAACLAACLVSLCPDESPLLCVVITCMVRHASSCLPRLGYADTENAIAEYWYSCQSNFIFLCVCVYFAGNVWRSYKKFMLSRRMRRLSKHPPLTSHNLPPRLILDLQWEGFLLSSVELSPNICASWWPYHTSNCVGGLVVKHSDCYALAREGVIVTSEENPVVCMSGHSLS